MGLAITSMILGIVGILVSCCFYWLTFICAVVGLILGIIALKKKTAGKGMAIAGIILNAISAVFGVVMIFLGTAVPGILGIDSFLSN